MRGAGALASQLLGRLAELRAAEPGPLTFLSGEALARELGVSRAAVSKAAATLRRLGVELQSLPRRGYRLARPTSPLRTDAVVALLSPQTQARLREGRCAWSLPSTNTALLEADPPPPGRFDWLTAEVQTAGRGRQGRRWLAPPAGTICLSLGWSFARLPGAAGAMSLAIGVAALRALQRLGIAGVGLKWPNDLLAGGDKLAGILVELRSEGAGPVRVVVGIGLNVALGPAPREAIAAAGTRAGDLEQLCGTPPPRERLVATLLDECVDALAIFEARGFAAFVDDYRAADVLCGRPVRATGAVGIEGIARGIDHDGSLLVESGGRLARIVSGEVSVRAMEAAP